MSRHVLLSASIALALLSGCARETPAPEEVRPVRVARVQAQPGGMAASYSGEVRARRETALGFQVTGRVQQRLVEVGDSVKAGQALMRLDASDAALNANASRSQLDSARSQYKQAQLDFQRYERLAAKAYVSRYEFEKAKLSRDTAAESYRAAEANYRMAANQAAYTTLHAPVAGVVTAIEVEAGQVVPSGQIAVRVAQDGEREIVVSVPEGRVEELRQARSLAIELWAGGGKRYRGRLRELAPDIDSVTRTYDARIAIEDADAAVRLGMTGKVAVELPTQASLRKLPLTAIYDADGATSVWVVDPSDSRARLRRVQLASAQRDGVLVRSGVRDGDLVITAGVNLLHDGQKVRPMAAPAAAPAIAQAGAQALAAHGEG
jgi:RND family efflux transporter MFP subunit